MGDCGVCIRGDYEVADIFEQTIDFVGRKEHKCCECGEHIPAGAKHEKIDMLYDGHWAHFRTCSVCAEIAEAFQCDGRVPTALWEDMWEVMDGLTTGCFSRLKTPEAKAKLQRRWMEWKLGR